MMERAKFQLEKLRQLSPRAELPASSLGIIQDPHDTESEKEEEEAPVTPEPVHYQHGKSESYHEKTPPTDESSAEPLESSPSSISSSSSSSSSSSDDINDTNDNNSSDNNDNDNVDGGGDDNNSKSHSSGNAARSLFRSLFRDATESWIRSEKSPVKEDSTPFDEGAGKETPALSHEQQPPRKDERIRQKQEPEEVLPLRPTTAKAPPSAGNPPTLPALNDHHPPRDPSELIRKDAFSASSERFFCEDLEYSDDDSSLEEPPEEEEEADASDEWEDEWEEEDSDEESEEDSLVESGRAMEPSRMPLDPPEEEEAEYSPQESFADDVPEDESSADELMGTVAPLTRHEQANQRAQQRTGWMAYNSSSSSVSSGFSPTSDLTEVYVKDEVYEWIPARVLSFHTAHALVCVDTNASSWTRSTVLERNEEMPAGGVHPSVNDVARDELNRMAVLHGVSASQIRKVQYDDYENGDLPLQNQGEGKRDMADLAELHSAAILYNLKERHHNAKPYTRVGDILIAMNPFLWISELYQSGTRDVYSKNLVWEDPGDHNDASALAKKVGIYERLGFEPHVYEVSSLAYKGLATTGQDQTILVTGESGAGKTETVKIVMNHLATVQRTRPGGVPSEHSTSKEIVQRVLQSSPVFEAFGNAKTVRNANSSRFGKFIQLQFQLESQELARLAERSVPYTDLVGSKCTTYLLEKNRVVNHDFGERSFHIFYQILAAPRDVKELICPALIGKTATDFAYTMGDIETTAGDLEAWEETVVALETFRYRDSSLKSLVQALVIILQLGNLIFTHDSIDAFEEHNTYIQNKDQLEELSALIGIDASDLQKSMTSRLLVTPGNDAIKVKLSPQVAKESCDALAKEIYSVIFDVLVRKMNNYTAYPESLLSGGRPCGHIALLDIFGFERFEVNRFEQLCINYANERLHQKYVLDNFNEVKDEYEIEGVDLYDFKLVDNSEVLDLLEGSPGVIVTLNEECVRPKGSAESFVYKTKIMHEKSTKLINRKLHRKHEFGIEHFTGPVEYDAQNFVGCNMDKLPDGLVECAARSQNTIIGAEFKAILSQRRSEGFNGRASNRRRKSNNRTVLQKFQTQLMSLLGEMHGTKTRYIRCIKPNTTNTPRKTSHKSTMQQLECSGLMTALVISRESFPNKLPYDFILDRYSCLMMEKDFEDIGTMDLKHKVNHVLEKWLKPLSKKSRSGSRTMPFACGKTKVFFKAGAQDKLEDLRALYFERGAVKIQTWLRKHAAVSAWKLKRRQIPVIQSFARMLVVKSRFRLLQNAATKLSAWIRGRQSVALLASLRKEKAATTIQARTRVVKAVKEFKNKIKAIRIIQQAFRAFRAKTIIRKKRKAMQLKKRKELQKKSERVQSTAEIIESKMSKLPVTKGKSEVVVPEYGNMLGNLRAEVESLRIDREALKSKLAASDAERQGLADKVESSEKAVSTYRTHVKDLLKANDSLVKEVYRSRNETIRARKRVQTNAGQIESKLKSAAQDLEEYKVIHDREVNELKRALKVCQKKVTEQQTTFNEALAAKKEKYDAQRRKLNEKLRMTQDSHQDYLNKIMGVLENTHATKEVEVAALTAELNMVRQQKDDYIIVLKQEVEALKATQKGGMKNIRAAVNPHLLHGQLSKESEMRARRSAQFDDIMQSLNSLVTASCALPADINGHDMTGIIEQQDRGQKMTEMLDMINHLYKMEEDSQHKTSQTSLALIEEYVALTEPNRTTVELRNRLSRMDLEINRLREELRTKEVCKRCAVRASAAQRRIYGHS